MKKLLRNALLMSFFITAPLAINTALADDPPLPGGPGGPGGPVGSSPIDGGFSLMLALGAAYGVKRSKSKE